MISVRDMYDSGEWLDVTMAGSSFEVQLNQKNGQYRHRPRAISHNPNVEFETEWRMGKPKEGPHNV